MRSREKLAGMEAGENPDIATGVLADLHTAAVCAAARVLIAEQAGRTVRRAGVLPIGGGHWLAVVDLERPQGSPAMRGFTEARNAYAPAMACQLLKLFLPGRVRADALRGDALTVEAFALAGLADNPRQKCVGSRRNVYGYLRDRAPQLAYITNVIERRRTLIAAEIVALMQHIRATHGGPPKKKKPRGVSAPRG